MKSFLYLSIVASFENVRPSVIEWFLINIQIQPPPQCLSNHFVNGGTFADAKVSFKALK